jgi:hypothetical protein
MIGPEWFSDSPEEASEPCGDCIGMVGKGGGQVLIDVHGMVVIMAAIRCAFISACLHDMAAYAVHNARRKLDRMLRDAGVTNSGNNSGEHTPE